MWKEDIRTEAPDSNGAIRRAATHTQSEACFDFGRVALIQYDGGRFQVCTDLPAAYTTSEREAEAIARERAFVLQSIVRILSDADARGRRSVS